MSSKFIVIFKSKRIADRDWQIQAHCPGAEIRYVTGFKTEAEVDEWLAGGQRHEWLKKHSYPE